MKTKKALIVAAAIALLVLLLVATSVMASRSESPSLSPGVPGMINYQGRLTDASGALSTGVYTMTFSLYDASTEGTLMWGPEMQSVTLTDGLFNVLLGSVNPLDASDFTGATYLELEVDGEVLSPRQQIVSVAYAFIADTLQPGATISGNSSSPMLTVQNSGSGHGLYAIASSGNQAVYGENTGSGVGVRGVSNSGYAGVSGGSNSGYGVMGLSTTNDGVRGESGSGIGVDGISYDGYGVSGYSVNSYGVRAKSDGSDALYVDGSAKFTGQIQSTAITGTAPFSVTSTTMNPDLNADMVDGKHASDFASAFRIGNSVANETNMAQETLFTMSTTGWVVRDDGDADFDHSLILETTGTLMEYTLWYGGTVVHGEASAGSPATITFPHYQGFTLILARHYDIAHLVCNENDGIIACVYQTSDP